MAYPEMLTYMGELGFVRLEGYCGKPCLTEVLVRLMLRAAVGHIG